MNMADRIQYLRKSQGKTVLQPKQEKRRVMSEGTAYITKSILKAPVKIYREKAGGILRVLTRNEG